MSKLKNTMRVAVTTVLTDVMCGEDVEAWLQSNACYQVIGGSQHSLLNDPWKVVVHLLPFSKNRLLDICLPFDSPNTSRTCGRYLLFQNKVIAIHIKISSHSPSHFPYKLPLPPSLSYFYSQHNIQDSFVLVGDFYLEFKKLKIGFVFQSQLERDSNLLQNLYAEGCQVLSVVADDNKIDKRRNELCGKQRHYEAQLLELSRSRNLGVIFCGSKVVRSFMYTFISSWVSQGQTHIRQDSICLAENVNLIFEVNIEEANKYKVYFQNKINEHVFVNKHRIQLLQHSLRSVAFVKEEQKIQKYKIMNPPFSTEDILLLHLWYLFHSLNRKTPFVLLAPLSKLSQSLAKDIIKMTIIASLNISKTILLFSTQGFTPEQFTKQLPLFDSFQTMLNVYPRIVCYLDEDLPFNLKLTAKQLLFYQISKIYSQSVLTKTTSEIEQLCISFLNTNINSFMELYAFFVCANLSHQQTKQAIINELVPRMRRCVKLCPLQLMLLECSEDEIGAMTDNAQLRSVGQLQSDWNKIPFKVKVEEARKEKIKQSNNLSCHKCSKKFQPRLLSTCNLCRTNICSHCLDVVTMSKLTNQLQYACKVCSGECQCNKCKKISFPLFRNKKSFLPPKSTIFDQRFTFQAYNCVQCMCDTARFILIQCPFCKKTFCYNCVSKNYFNAITEWKCFQCNKSSLIKQVSKQNLVPLLLDLKTIANKEIKSPMRIQSNASIYHQKKLMPEKKLLYEVTEKQQSLIKHIPSKYNERQRTPKKQYNRERFIGKYDEDSDKSFSSSSSSSERCNSNSSNYSSSLSAINPIQ